MTRKDQCGNLLPLSETSGSFDRDYFSLTLVIGDGQSDDTWRHLMVIRTLIIQRQQVQ